MNSHDYEIARCNYDFDAGEYFEEGGVHFLADSVKEIGCQPDVELEPK